MSLRRQKIGQGKLHVPSVGSAITQAKLFLLQNSIGFPTRRTALPAHDSDMLNSLARLDEDLADISNPLRDCILGHNDLSIEEALNLDSSHINSLDTMGFAPLHLAVMRKDIQKTKALLRHHALVDIRTGPYSQTGENSKTSLHIAAASGCSTLASVLLLHGAHIDERAPNYGLTPLHYAAYRAENPSEVIKLLLEMGANPNLKDSQGWTALHFLAQGTTGYYGCWKKDRGTRAAYYLVQHGADVNQQSTTGETPIMYSTRRRSLSLLWHFFQIGARLDITNDWGFNVFHFLGTSSWEHPEQAAYLSSLQIAGVGPDAPTLIGISPIHFLES